MFIDAVTLPSRAVLLDVDGTILDLAPTPLEVVVPPDLTVALERLSKRVGGALAFVSGRPLAELDLFFAPLKLPAIAGHGAELRLADGTVQRATTFLDPQLKAELASDRATTGRASLSRTRATRLRCIIGWCRISAATCARR